ncbi:MAG: hypothetical protein HC892_19390 [Saprospiraceae bacterium]|nr:hypothetical protein [Saprospiraceae bacterium]
MGIRKIIQFFALGLLLIVLPVGSLLYLRSGYFERYNALQELKDYGKLPDFQLQTPNGGLNNQQLRGRYVVLGKMETFDESHPIIDQSKKLFTQFGDSKEIAICTYVRDMDSLAVALFLDKMIQDTASHWYFLSGEPVFKKLFEEYEPNYLALIDTSSVIRHFYNADKDTEVGEMAKHVAMFVAPLKRSGELIYEREKEK